MQFMNDLKVKSLSTQIRKRFGGRSECFPEGLTAFGAFYRVRTTFNDMRLHLHVGDETQTIWVQNFSLPEPFLKLAVALNEPDPASLLVNPADVGWNIPAYINSQLYCDATLARDFCQKNRTTIESLQLTAGERLCVQRCQIRLRLLTDQLDRVQQCLTEIGHIFHQQHEP